MCRAAVNMCLASLTIKKKVENILPGFVQSEKTHIPTPRTCLLLCPQWEINCNKLPPSFSILGKHFQPHHQLSSSWLPCQHQFCARPFWSSRFYFAWRSPSQHNSWDEMCVQSKHVAQPSRWLCLTSAMMLFAFFFFFCPFCVNRGVVILFGATWLSPFSYRPGLLPAFRTKQQDGPLV